VLVPAGSSVIGVSLGFLQPRRSSFAPVVGAIVSLYSGSSDCLEFNACNPGDARYAIAGLEVELRSLARAATFWFVIPAGCLSGRAASCVSRIKVPIFTPERQIGGTSNSAHALCMAAASYA